MANKKAEKPLTKSQIKALTILKDTTYRTGMASRLFAEKMWGETDTNMFTKSSNTGNGACRGKAAWLCAGSYAGRLRVKGLVGVTFDPTSYYISPKGKEMLQAHEQMNA